MATGINKMLASLKDRPRSYRLNLAAGLLAVIVAVVAIIAALRTPDLSAVAAPEFQATPAQVQAEIAGLRARTDQLAADLKALQTDLREAAALPKDAKLALQQQQTQKTLKDLLERQERLEQIIVANPGKALELALLQRDLEHLRSVQQQGLTVIGAAVAATDGVTKWVLAGMALSVLMLVAAALLKGKEP